jgi:hypothetical protein
MSLFLYNKADWERFFDCFKDTDAGRLWWLMPVIPTTWQASVGGLWTEASLGKNCDALSESKKAGDVVQVRECLLRKQGPEFKRQT